MINKIGRFLTETDIQTSDIIEGNLIDQVDKLLDVLRVKYLKAYIAYEGHHRREKLEYPYDALKEAIINALIHRDYSNTSNLQIKVYNDKLVMYNGAWLSDEVPIEKFDKPHQSKPFNPLISLVFYKAGFIENWGKGTLNIIAECLAYGLPKPTYEYEWTAVRTTFYKAKTNVGVNEVFEFIKQHQPTKANVIAQSFNVTQRTIERYIKQLKDSEKVEFRGSSKTGGYYVK